MRAMEISMTALDVEWRRLEVIAENLANASVAVSPNSPSYRELHLISGPKNDFAALLNRDGGINVAELAGVEVRGTVPSDAPPRLVHEPGNPLANAQGFVAYPAIDHAAAMTEMLETARIYEANIVAVQTAHEMYSKALQLGSRSA